jgi:hypothetical protein
MPGVALTLDDPPENQRHPKLDFAYMHMVLRMLMPGEQASGERADMRQPSNLLIELV